ncbi:MAG: pirin family protein [Flavobacteriaceae bacterium]|nr:pirin family protein [Flavobacteriaceae bacterium]
MKTLYHAANSRGHANHGWLDTHHTFSFSGYHNPERIHFGVLRVLNDDWVKGGMGFGKHPHNNMEIITIPLSGALKHGDSMGNHGIIQKGEVQVMSAGTGIVHSEMNANSQEAVTFLQIWLFPREMNVEPRYDQIRIADDFVPNEFQQIVSPHPNDVGTWIHQDAWFHMANFEQGISKKYDLKKQENGVYVFLIEGKIKIGDQILEKRDGFGLWETDSFEIEAIEKSEILLMEIPMTLPQ